MIESIIISFLNNETELSAPVYTEVPKDEPAEFFVIENTGTALRNHIQSTTLAIRSHAQSLERAADLLYQADAVLTDELIKLDEISGIRRNSIYNFTDPGTKKYRYQGVYIITHY